MQVHIDSIDLFWSQMNTDTDTDTDTDADTDVHMKIVCCNHVLNLQTNTGGKAGYLER